MHGRVFVMKKFSYHFPQDDADMYGEIRDEDDDDENEGVEADEDVKLTANVSS